MAPRVGEIWAMPDGRRIEILDIAGSAVSGNSSPLELDEQGPTGPGMGAVDYRGDVKEFEDFTLVGPRWAATFTAAVVGSHPTQDEVFGIVQALGTVEHRRIGSASGSTISQNADYELTIFALTVDEVEARLTEALRVFGGVTNLDVKRTDLPPPIVVGG